MNSMFVKRSQQVASHNTQQVKTFSQFSTCVSRDLIVEHIVCVLNDKLGVKLVPFTDAFGFDATRTHPTSGVVQMRIEVFEMTPRLHMVECRRIQGKVFAYHDLFNAFKGAMLEMEKVSARDSPTDPPDDWCPMYDESSSQFFYHNKVKGLTQWRTPASWADSPNHNAANWSAHYSTKHNRVFYHNSVTHLAKWSLPACVQVSDEHDPSSWVRAVDPTSKHPFYFNSRTHVSVWQRPPCVWIPQYHDPPKAKEEAGSTHLVVDGVGPSSAVPATSVASTSSSDQPVALADSAEAAAAAAAAGPDAQQPTA